MSAITEHFRFEAAHLLPRVPADHKCRRLHGHSYRAAISAEADPAVLVETVARLREQLDHRYLNELPGLENPTSENIARWLWQQLTARSAGRIVSVELAETCESACIYRGE